MYEFVKFVHIIAAMIYFAMPFSFGRWFSSADLADNPAPMEHCLDKIKLFAMVYLNLCGLLLIGTGLYMAMARGWWDAFWFPKISLGLTGLTLAQINLILLPWISEHRTHLSGHKPGGNAAQKLRRKLALFSASHHTIVSIITALMIWRW